MIDSLNLIIRIKYIDLNHIKKLGIEVKFFSDVNISFEYKNIEFKYDSLHQYLLIMTNPHKVLGKKDILLSDKEEYKTKLLKIIREILPTQDISIEVNRIDYCVDIFVGEKIGIYCELLNRHPKKFCYMRQKKTYKTSKYLTNKRGQRHLNFYNRYAKTSETQDIGVLRLEIQNNPPKIKKEYKDNNIPKTIDYYWSKEAMQQYFFEFLKPYLFEGDYYKGSIYKKMVNESDEKKLVKKRLNEFSLMESRYGIDGLIQKKKFCYDTERKYIQILNNLNINPITIPDNCKYDYLENVLKLARKVAEEKYFK